MSNLSTDKQQSRDRLVLGGEALRCRKFEEALSHFVKITPLNDDAAKVQMCVGMALEGLGKIEAARVAYQRALRISPECDEAGKHLLALPPRPPVPQEWIVGQELTSDINREWQYKIEDIKRGGFGIVYVVSDPERHRFALKTLQSHFTWSEDDRRRFEREIVTWLRLGNHPRIVHALCLDRAAGRPLLTMEYVTGGTVSDLIAQKPLGIESALALGLDVCAAMDYAHKKLGIIHRDLKPANCLLSETGRLKVTDFGLAKMMSEFKARDLGLPESMAEVALLASTPLGTESYMPPEQFEHGAVLDTRTDIYSFGVMLFEMLTGELPMVGPAAQELVNDSEAAKALPKNLWSIIFRCVAKDRDERPGSFDLLQIALADEYRQITGLEPPESEAISATNEGDFNALGLTFSLLGHFEEAVTFFDQALEISPLDRHFLSNKGTVLRKLGKFADAFKCYSAALEVAPDEATIWGNVAQLFLQVGEYSSALNAFDTALETMPHDPTLIANKAVALFHLGMHTEALEWNAKSLSLEPNAFKGMETRADFFSMLGRYSEALEWFDRAIDVNPLNYEAWNGKARALQKCGRLQDALMCINRSLELQPNQPRLEELRRRLLNSR